MPTPLQCKPELLSKTLNGKVVIVTGANCGIGLVTSKQLVHQGATVIMACRDTARGEKAAAEAGGVFMLLDLASLQSVRVFAAKFCEKYQRLDILVNNAAVMACPLGYTDDGFELQFGTNHLGHFLLTQMLQDLLEKSAPSRVICVSSVSACEMSIGDYKMDPYIDFGDIHWKSRKYHPGGAYGQSKLANVLHAQEIAKRYKGVTSCSLHPGWVQTDLMRHMIPKCIMPCAQCVFMSMGKMMNVKDGMQTTLHCCLTDDLENGAFYSQVGIYKDKASQAGGWPMKLPNPNAYDSANAAKLWEESEKMVGLRKE